MARILTFLGKGGVGRTTAAIAAAKQYAGLGKRVLLVVQDPGPAPGLQLGVTLGPDPQSIEPNLKAVQLQVTVLLERGWEELKQFEAQYLRNPFFKEVFGQELGVFPGVDAALSLYAIRGYDDSGEYDVIVYDGAGDLSTLRLLGMPENLGWYARRFGKVIRESDLGKTLSPFVQPVASATLTMGWSNDALEQPMNQANQLLEQGRAALADPDRFAAYLVTTADPVAIATARYLWGSAQQTGLTVSGVLLNQDSLTDIDLTAFAPLTISVLPTLQSDNWQPLMEALPDFSAAKQAPSSMSVDLAARQVRLFLPSFDKKQVKLTQYGPEVTIEAGDQRRNLSLPPELSGRQVTGAKFQNGYLVISF